MGKKTEKTFSVRARNWAQENKLHGPQAFLRYVFFDFLDCLARGGDEFIFKGGNLLWLYIRTPRQTIDLDLVTREANTLERVEKLLEAACKRGKGIAFRIESLTDVSDAGSKGASAIIRFEAEDGATNTFDLDIVYVLPTDSMLMKSPLLTETKIRVATIENILFDKITTCHRFGAGNTRMKDFDDLWRLSQSEISVDWSAVRKRLMDTATPMALDVRWINSETEIAWKRHVRRYKDLPQEMITLFTAINAWLAKHS